MNPVIQILIAAIFNCIALPAWASGDIYLFGGGHRDARALRAFSISGKHAPNAAARVLVIAWASADPRDTASGVAAELASLGVEIRLALAPPETGAERAQLDEDLEWADAFFFSGGDQSRLLDAIDRINGLRETIVARWRAGTALAGTSAGTAALSERVFTGNEDSGKIDPGAIALRPGIGVLPGVIIDQHFLVRARENRLFSAVLRYPDSVGVGIDENNALVVRGGRGCVSGPTAVMRVEATDQRSLEVRLFRDGECFRMNFR